MRTLVAIAIAILALSFDAQGQQRPGLAVERTATDQMPGEHRGKPSGCEDDVTKLRQLVDTQSKYIELLEAKIKKLEQGASARRVVP
jgi:hypothetical protein